MKDTSCQAVRGMTVKREKYTWDNNDFCRLCDRSYQFGGDHPQNDYSGEDNTLTYCYYAPDPNAKEEEDEEKSKIGNSLVQE